MNSTDATKMTSQELLAFYNAHAPRPVKRFENRAIAVRRVLALKVTEISANGRVGAVTSLVNRASGVKLTELMDRFGWQAHSARGFMSTLASKHGVEFVSMRVAGERVYKAT